MFCGSCLQTRPHMLTSHPMQLTSLRRRSPRFSRSMTRPGVPTTTSMPRLRMELWGPMGAPVPHPVHETGHLRTENYAMIPAAEYCSATWRIEKCITMTMTGAAPRPPSLRGRGLALSNLPFSLSELTLADGVPDMAQSACSHARITVKGSSIAISRLHI